jgi:hypothetical protein
MGYWRSLVAQHPGRMKVNGSNPLYSTMFNRWRKPKTTLQFGEKTIFASCWCDGCGWAIDPVGWYGENVGITLEEMVDIWQWVHDEDSDDECVAIIAWEETPE